MRRFATGVTVVTIFDGDMTLVGSTARSFTSVSLDPPLVLVCLNHESRTYKHSVQQGCYAINILGPDQEAIARGFATRGGSRSEICGWQRGPQGMPLLDGIHAALECNLEKEIRIATHAILIGRVVGFALASENSGQPLVFYGGRMTGLDF
jgi:flavin reductase (DIM6/NTAB) family NADH-FMN oxidoreductase RutF